MSASARRAGVGNFRLALVGDLEDLPRLSTKDSLRRRWLVTIRAPRGYSQRDAHTVLTRVLEHGRLNDTKFGLAEANAYHVFRSLEMP
ncbi:MAG: hypothetical protein IPK82_29555 [Polyangiaceae bacterium]|nr:hypothetical protein [Polyangiaceae bacterium]